MSGPPKKSLPVVPPKPEKEEEEGNQNEQEIGYEEEEEVKYLENGITTSDTVHADCYKYFSCYIEAAEDDDVVEIFVHKTLQAGGINIYMNGPQYSCRSENAGYPDAHTHEWNPTMKPWLGSAGEYKFSVQGVGAFIQDDTKWLVSKDSNIAKFNLTVTWNVLDPERKKKLQELKETYGKGTASSIWELNNNEALLEKYQEQQQEMNEYENKLLEVEQKPERKIDLTSHPVSQKIDIGDILGQGFFATVKKGKRKDNQKEVAIKIIDKNQAQEQGISEEFLKERLTIVESVKNANYVGYSEKFEDKDAVVLVQEIQEGGEAIKALSQSSSYTEETARAIVSQLLDIVDDLHLSGIVHRYIAPENLLFRDKDLKKISLTGLTLGKVNNEETNNDIVGGSATLQAPEVATREGYGTAADMWNIGIIAFVLLSGKLPFEDSNTMRLFSKIQGCEYDMNGDEWKDVSNEGKEFIQKLLVSEKEKRLTAQQAKAHPWVKASGGKDLPIAKKNLTQFNY